MSFYAVNYAGGSLWINMEEVEAVNVGFADEEGNTRLLFHMLSGNKYEGFLDDEELVDDFMLNLPHRGDYQKN